MSTFVIVILVVVVIVLVVGAITGTHRPELLECEWKDHDNCVIRFRWKDGSEQTVRGRDQIWRSLADGRFVLDHDTKWWLDGQWTLQKWAREEAKK